MDPAHSQLSITANRAPTVLEREQDKPHFSHPTALKSSLEKCAVRSRAQKRHSQQQGALGSQPPGDGVGQPTGSGVDRDVGCPQTVNYDPVVEIFMEKRKNLTLHMIKYSSNYTHTYICICVYTYMYFFRFFSIICHCCCCCSAVSVSLQPHGLQHASLSFTISQSLLTLMSIESVMPSNHLILCRPLLLLLSIFPASESFPMCWLFPSDGQSIGAFLL